MDEHALLTVPVQVHVIVCARVGFCAVRAHERFGQCANAVSLCSTVRGACDNEIACSVLVCVSVYR